MLADAAQHGFAVFGTDALKQGGIDFAHNVPHNHRLLAAIVHQRKPCCNYHIWEESQ
jgi:hypothetical protein